jgi:HlyD family secretion protein
MQPLLTLADLSRLWVRVYVSEQDLGRVRLGEAAVVRVDAYPARTFTGRVSWISPKAEFTPKNVQTREARADLVYAVKVDLANPRGELKIGMPADVSFGASVASSR